MAEIIDLDFYRKFRIILPVRPRAVLAKKKDNKSLRVVTKRVRRKNNPEIPSQRTTKD